MNFVALTLSALQTDAEIDRFAISMTVLLTGLVVIFSILLLLTFVIKIYSTAVHSIQEKIKRKKSNSSSKTNPSPKAAPPEKKKEIPVASAAAFEPQTEEGIPGEIIAAIAAVIAVMNEQGKTNYSVKSVKRSAASRPAWGMAGLMESTRPF